MSDTTPAPLDAEAEAFIYAQALAALRKGELDPVPSYELDERSLRGAVLIGKKRDRWPWGMKSVTAD